MLFTSDNGIIGVFVRLSLSSASELCSSATSPGNDCPIDCVRLALAMRLPDTVSWTCVVLSYQRRVWVCMPLRTLASPEVSTRTSLLLIGVATGSVPRHIATLSLRGEHECVHDSRQPRRRRRAESHADPSGLLCSSWQARQSLIPVRIELLLRSLQLFL